MTSGRFVLMRRKSALRKGVQTGLDVDVLDNNTGKIRTGESLSGGEAFMASLSLALGMSDVVSASHGGIRLESMFIDEGFGCLSEDSLEKALSVLVELSNSPEGGVARPVGIISHIGLLKERIHNKIQVEKSINGSRIVM